MNEYFDKGFSAFKRVDASLSKKALLREFAEALIDRVH
jgi:hypothetical protein